MHPTDHTSTGQVNQSVSCELHWLLTGFCVALEAQHDLRSSIPTGSHIFGHVACILFGIYREASSKAEIADFELTIGIDQKVSGFQISMKHIGRMDILQPAKDLVDERLKVGVGQRLTGPNDGREVAFHELYSPFNNRQLVGIDMGYLHKCMSR